MELRAKISSVAAPYGGAQRAARVMNTLRGFHATVFAAADEQPRRNPNTASAWLTVNITGASNRICRSMIARDPASAQHGGISPLPLPLPREHCAL